MRLLKRLNAVLCVEIFILSNHLIKCIHSVCLSVSYTIIELETTHGDDSI
jgi:hypothetical protein